MSVIDSHTVSLNFRSFRLPYSLSSHFIYRISHLSILTATVPLNYRSIDCRMMDASALRGATAAAPSLYDPQQPSTSSHHSQQQQSPAWYVMGYGSLDYRSKRRRVEPRLVRYLIDWFTKVLWWSCMMSEDDQSSVHDMDIVTLQYPSIAGSSRRPAAPPTSARCPRRAPPRWTGTDSSSSCCSCSTCSSPNPYS